MDGHTTCWSSIGSNSSTRTELQPLDANDAKYDLDWAEYPLEFSHFPTFPPWSGDIINHVSNDEPTVNGKTNEQQQEHEERNADRA